MKENERYYFEFDLDWDKLKYLEKKIGYNKSETKYYDNFSFIPVRIMTTETAFYHCA